MLIFVITLFTVAIYLSIINNLIIIDDIRWLPNAKKGGKGEGFHKGNIIRRIRFRLYGIGTLWNNKWSDERNIKIDHALTIALHAVASSLIYIAFGSNLISFSAAILYSCNPINNQTAIWSNGRRYLINVILILSILIFKPLIVILYPMSFLFHFTAFASPILLGWWGVPLMLIGVVAAYKPLKAKVDIRLGNIHSKELKSFAPKRLIPMTKIYGFYIFKMIFPGTTRMIYPDLYFWGITEDGNKDAYALNGAFWRGVVAISGSIAGCFFFKGPTLFMWLFLCVSVAQWCIFAFSAVQGLADRYISASTPFMMFFLATFIHTFAGVYAGPIIACLIVYYVSMLTISFDMYKDIHAFYNYHIYHDPKHPAVRHLKASWKILSNRPMEAWPLLAQGLEHCPNDFRLNLAASECCFMFRDAVGIKHFIDRCEKNYYIGQEKVMAPRIKAIKDKAGISAFEDEVELIKQGKSKLPAVERKRILDAAGVK